MHIEKGELSVDIKAMGAELTSIRYNGREFLWSGDEKYWGRQSPVLFPIVGRLKDNTAVIDGKEYSMGQHGFARDKKFIEEFASDSKVTYLLKDDAETLKVYPYKFELRISYEIFENKVKVTYDVKNVDSKNIWFSIGGHPAFRWPLVDGESFEDYCIEFNKNESQKFIRNDGGILDREDSFIIENDDKIELSKSKFDIDTFVFENPKSDVVTLRSKKSGAYVSVAFEKFSYLGIWSKENEAEFVCIEPWCGIADFKNHDKDFRNKEGIIELEVGKNFERSYIIEVGV